MKFSNNLPAVAAGLETIRKATPPECLPLFADIEAAILKHANEVSPVWSILIAASVAGAITGMADHDSMPAITARAEAAMIGCAGIMAAEIILHDKRAATPDRFNER